MTTTEPVSDSRIPPEWLRPLLWITIPLVLGTVVFWLTDLDRGIVALFYQPEHPVHRWPFAQGTFWDLVYDSDRYITIALAVAGLGLILLGQVRRDLRLLRVYGLFVVLSLTLGPGLVVNVLLKDNTGRPRPNQIVEFGGQATYHPLFVLGERGVGKSFPSGHSSVGFVIAMFWFLWRKESPALARSFLVLALALGLLLGFQRVISGSHFPSDILWSAGLSMLVPLLLYYFVLRVPQREAYWRNQGGLA